jgi:hypothetical protein
VAGLERLEAVVDGIGARLEGAADAVVIGRDRQADSRDREASQEVEVVLHARGSREDDRHEARFEQHLEALSHHPETPLDRLIGVGDDGAHAHDARGHARHLPAQDRRGVGLHRRAPRAPRARARRPWRASG